jgi:DNA mismatch repair protein MutS
MMRQYCDIRKKLSAGTLLFFRLGDFYEMFYEDAEEASRLLNLTLTHRNGVPMAGVPYHAATSYIDKLLKAGKKVALCDQMEAPQPGKKLVERSLTRIISPGTVLEDTQLGPKTNHYIVCIEAKLPLLCAAWLDLSTGEFKLCCEKNIEDIVSVLVALYPKELIIQDTLDRLLSDCPLFREKMAPLLNEQILSRMPANAFNITDGYTHLKEVINLHTLDGFGIESTFPALGSAGALLQYVTQSLCQKPRNIRGVTIHFCAESLIVNPSSLRSLEIFKTLYGGRENSLLDVLDKSVTSAGARRVEQFLTQPLRNVDAVRSRQNVVKSFVDEPSVARSLQKKLARTHDILRSLGRLQNRGQNPRELGCLQETLAVLPEIKGELDPFEIPEIKALNHRIRFCEPLREQLKKALRESLPNDLTLGGYIREGYDETLDRLKNLTTSNRTWLTELERNEQKKTGIRNLKIRYSQTFGYYIEVTHSQLSLVPLRYIRKQTTVNSERYYTEELKTKEQEILQAGARAIEREREIFVRLVDLVRDVSDDLRETAEVLADIDVFVGWSLLARENAYTCPQVDHSECIDIQQGRHPVVERTLRHSGFRTGFVANDTFLDTTEDQILLITGPNMAGKSTYIRQVALIVLMAQVGCWVPAKSCRIGLVDRIFSRVGANDDLSRGQSTFMVEMTETANILNNATHKSLLILDEIGRGTSTYDGLSIAWSIVEHLHGSLSQGPRTLFATHYHELTQLEALLPRVVNYSVAVKEWNEEIIFVHQIVKGAASRSYGIQVAKLAGLPPAVIERAKSILQGLEKEGQTLQKALKSTSLPVRKNPASPQLKLF